MKYYIKITNSNNASHTLVRVDDIKAFNDIINGDECKVHFKAVLTLIKLGQKPDRSPYQIEVAGPIFDFLTKRVNMKISSIYKPKFRAFNIVLGSYSLPIIRIVNAGFKEAEVTIAEPIL